MGLWEALATGAPGARLTLDGLERIHDGPRELRAADPARGVSWALRWVRTPMDLSPASWAATQEDCRLSTRHAYAHAWVPPGADHPLGPELPRTDDPAFSPVVELSPVRLRGDGPGLRLVHRVQYQRGRERVLGVLAIPVARGVLEVAAMAESLQTGTRECLLMMKLGGRPSQAEYDDPRWDGLFPDHVLSRVRAALDWVMGPRGVLVLEPDPRAEEAPPRHVALEGAGGTARLARGFRRISREEVGASRQVDVFVRARVPGEPQAEYLDVFRSRSGPAPRSLAGLEEWARRNARAFSDGVPEGFDLHLAGRHEGGGDLAVDLTTVLRGEVPRRRTLHRMLVRGDRLVRFGLSVPPWREEAAARAELTAVVASWRPGREELPHTA